MDDVRRLVRLLFCVSRDIVYAPVRGRLRQWAIVLSVAAAATLAYVEKRPLQALIEYDGRGAVHLLGLFGEATGRGLVVTCLGVAAFAVGRGARKPAGVDAA